MQNDRRVVHRLAGLLFLSLLLGSLVPAAFAGGLAERLGGLFANTAENDILPPEQAFVFSADISNPARIVLRWEVVDGYYLYRDKFKVSSENPAVAVGELDIPRGEIESDPEFGDVEVLRGNVEVVVPLSRAGVDIGIVDLVVSWQGCKQDTICYPPQSRTLELFLSPIPQATGANADSGTVSTGAANAGSLSAQDSITARLRDGSFLLNIAAFFGFGLLLSLTPCIFPMIPILSGIIVGQNSVRRVTAWSGFLLSLAYVVAMALTYAVLGMIAGSFNFNLQAASQNVWALSAFSAVFVLLALSMFGFYQLQLPASWQTRLQAIGSERSGSLLGAAIMGVLSAIIVGPCVAPPLAGALLYISQTGDALLGGLALFVLGLGLGMPLLLLGAAGGRLLPQAGVWMNAVKQVFGVIMLGVAIWFLERLFAGPVTLMLWALLLIISAVYMGALDTLAADARWRRLWKGLGLAMLVYGVVLIVAAVGGGKDPLRPLQDSDWLQPVNVTMSGPGAAAGVQSGHGEQLQFEMAEDADAARAAILQAGLEGRPAMLYFTAEWCIVCKELEQYTFRDADVVRALNGFSLIKVDVTANSPANREILKKYELFGPPAMLFFNTEAGELRPLRLVGFIEAEEFVRHIYRVPSI